MKLFRWLLLVISLGVNVLLGVIVLDSAISLDHARMQADHLRRREQESLQLLRAVWIGRDETDLLATFRQLWPSADPVTVEGEVVTSEGITFGISEGKVSGVDVY